MFKADANTLTMTGGNDASRCAPPAEQKPPLLMIGVFLSWRGASRQICEELSERLDRGGWPVLRTSAKHGRAARLADMLGTIWRRRHDYAVAQMDVFSGAAFAWAEAAGWTLRRAGKPYVLTLHGGNLPAFARHWPRRVRRLLGSAAAVTTPSQYLWQQMQPYRADLLLLPNPLDVAAYPFRRRTALRPRLIWLRAFHEIYNPGLAARVVALLARDIPEIQLTMIGLDKGDGSRQRTAALARQLGVADRITLADAIEKRDVPQTLSQADIFLNTTRVDNTPVSLMEALACGLCAVSTNVGGIPYLVADERHALLTPSDDAPAMAAAVRRLLAEPELAQRLSQNGRQQVEPFDWPRILPRWEELLRSIVDGCA
jgi:glycosyltransferase involved in cell wall biosynthesis